MKQCFIVYRPNNEIAAVYSTEKKAKRFCEEFGYRYETYLLE